MAWLSSWPYRKPVLITGSAGAGTDYPVSLEVHSGYSGITYGSDFCVDGSASADTEVETYEADKAFDNDPGTHWSSDSSALPHWVKYNLGVGITKTARKLRLRPYLSGVNCCVDAFKLQGSNNDSDWTDIISETASDSETWQEWEFENAIAYRYYRVYVTSNHRVDQYAAIVEIELMEATGEEPGPDSDGVVYLNDHCTDFPNDIRFTDDDGVTELDHFCKDLTADPAIFQIEVKDSLENGQTPDIYIYCGKDGAGSASNIEAAFLFGDDFPGDTLDLNKWTKKANANVTVSGGVATLKSSDASSSGIYTKTYNHSADGVAIEYQGKRGTSPSGTRTVGSMKDVNAMHKGAGGLAHYVANDGVKCWDYAGASDYDIGTIDNIFYDMVTYLKPDAIVVTGAGLTATKAETLESHPVGVGIPDQVGWFIKNFRVRKYVDPEPVVGTPGAWERRQVWASHQQINPLGINIYSAGRSR